MSALVELDRVSRVFSAGVDVVAVRDVSFDVHRGDFLAVTGPSGSGKSTLLGIMGCLDVPTAGVVRIDGRDPQTLSDRRRSRLRSDVLGFVFQQFHLIAHLSAVANVETALLYRGLSKAGRRSRAEAALERVGLSARAGHRPGQMSGGEQQRLALARALVGEPAVVLGDEPTGNLDSKNSAQVLDILEGFVADGIAVVVVSHSADVVARARRGVEILDGQVARRWERAA